jgi:hypothetical protein
LLPEFKGNVVAVETAPFWDVDLAALHVRWEKLNEKSAKPLLRRWQSCSRPNN